MLLYQEIKQICENISNNKEVKKSKINSILSRFKNEWKDIMVEANLYNKKFDTYSINNIQFKPYGIYCQIYIVPPLTYNKLNSFLDMIEENLNCCIIFNHIKRSKWINTKFIFNKKDKLEFNVIKQNSPYIIYLGNDYSGEPVFADLRKYPHILVSGTTRSGKSKLTDCILTNLIHNCSKNDLELYLFQVSKNDLILYEDCIHTRCFADNLFKALYVLEYIQNEVIPQRNEIIKPYRKKAILDNVYEYNNLKTTKEKLPMILLCFDEMASIFNTKGDDKDTKKIKEQIVRCIQNIAQYGGSLSIFLLSSIQRPTVDMMPSFIKSMSNTIISLRQANSKSSEVATDDSNLALDLKQREFVYKLDNWDYGLVPLVNNKTIYNIIKPKLDPNHKKLFDDVKYVNINEKMNKINKNKQKIENNSHFNKNKDEQIEENVAKIKDFVPYEPINDNVIVIDKTKIPIKTSKSKGMIKKC